jgi:DNA-binding response OmpR family regulator/DNA-directed RNA polymerase subunit RPC12/RpoP
LSDRVYHVLMVEDNPNHYKILQRFINKSGKPIEVDLVPSAHEFFNVFLAKNYDLIMLDYNLAQYTGLSILKKLNELDVITPIIMVTQQKDPEVAINAMKLGAVDYIIKSKENFEHLPDKIIAYVSDFENELANNDVFKLKRQNIMRNGEVREVFKYLISNKVMELNPKSSTYYYYNPGHIELEMEKETLEKILQVLTLNRMMIKKPIGVKVACPRCDSDDVVAVPVCPKCGGKVFVKNTTGEEAPLRCLSGCGEAFDEVKVTYKCNSCFKEFPQEDSRYKHIYVYSVNPQMLEEFKQVLVSSDELQLWEEKNKEYAENLEATRKMHEEIRTQLRELIEQQIKKS